MRTPIALAALAVAASVPAVAVAQDADTTPPSAVVQVNTTLNSIDSLEGPGLTFGLDPSEDITYTGKATVKIKGKTVTVAKSIRDNDVFNASGGFVEQSMPRGSDSAVLKLTKLKKGTKLAVTLTLSIKDTAGNKATVKKVFKLKKRY